MFRGFGLAGGTLFTAQDSFDTILGQSFGPLFGGGGQVVFPNGAFAQVGIERFRETGTRALVSGDQVFTVDFPEQVTVTPITISAGYRAIRPGPLTGYLGVGFGWHRLEEESLELPTAEPISTGHAGFHILGGAEYAVLPWVSLAGEVQWATVPKALGETGVSAFYDEDDLGGTTFRLKLIVGT
jgi:opacity protein-like surface antigen